MMSTTRRGRYLQRREKYKRRARRANRNSRDRTGNTRGRPFGVRGAVSWTMEGDGSKQLYYPRLPTDPPERVYGSAGVPPLSLTWNPRPHGEPPTVKAYRLGVQLSAPPSHWTRQLVFWHHRRVKYRGHKLGRCSGFWRLVKLAWVVKKMRERRLEGTGWPWWDPLQRMPVFEYAV